MLGGPKRSFVVVVAVLVLVGGVIILRRSENFLYGTKNVRNHIAPKRRKNVLKGTENVLLSQNEVHKDLTQIAETALSLHK